MTIWETQEPTKDEIERKEKDGFEWDDEKKAYLDLAIGDYIEPELVDRAYHLTDMETGELYRQYASEYDNREDRKFLAKMQEGGWDIKSLHELDQIDDYIKSEKERF